jgi:hypothetical protein
MDDALTPEWLASKIAAMRTTLSLDDDLAGLLKRRAQELGVPFKEAVNRTIRAGLGEAAKPARGKVPKTVPHSFGFRSGIDLDKLGQLADELEAEAYAVLEGGRSMTALTMRLPVDKHRRLRALAQSRGTTLNRLIDDMATAMLAEFDAETRFKLRAASGAGREARGLTLLDKASGAG